MLYSITKRKLIGFIGSKLLEMCVGVPIDCIVLIKPNNPLSQVGICYGIISVLYKCYQHDVCSQSTDTFSTRLSIIFSFIVRVILYSTLLLCLMFNFLRYPFALYYFTSGKRSEWKTTKPNGERKNFTLHLSLS